MKAKPIDWLKPLRPLSISNQVVRVLGIDPDIEFGITIRNLITGEERLVNRLGFVAHGDYQIVENVPPKPQIIERFVLVQRLPVSEGPVGYGLDANGPLYLDRKKVDVELLILGDPEYRIARVLIEEPSE